MIAILALLGLAILGFGKSEPKRDTHDNEGADYHQAWVMNGDGTRSTTWVACRCSKGADHDGAQG
jgi:hypothetical protein